MEPAATQNGECKSPLEGKELEESIPGLAQAKELAETLVAEDGSGIGTSQKKMWKAETATLVDSRKESSSLGVRVLERTSHFQVASIHLASCVCSVLNLHGEIFFN